MSTSPSASGKRPGIVYAATGRGCELPVLDVTHPAFTVADDPASLEKLRREFVEQGRQYRRVPGFMMRLRMKSAARRSHPLAAMLKPESETATSAHSMGVD